MIHPRKEMIHPRKEREREKEKEVYFVPAPYYVLPNSIVCTLLAIQQFYTALCKEGQPNTRIICGAHTIAVAAGCRRASMSLTKAIVNFSMGRVQLYSLELVALATQLFITVEDQLPRQRRDLGALIIELEKNKIVKQYAKYQFRTNFDLGGCTLFLSTSV